MKDTKEFDGADYSLIIIESAICGNLANECKVKAASLICKLVGSLCKNSVLRNQLAVSSRG